MPYLRTYRVFISHAWTHGDDYYRLVGMLDAAPHFRWENTSVPAHAPVSTEALEYELRNQMRPAHIFIVLGGMYVAYSEWIDFEIAFARRIGRPILGVRPRGNVMTPRAVQKAAIDVVAWNTQSIVDAIRRNALPE